MFKLAILFTLAFVSAQAIKYESFASFEEALEYEKSQHDFDANHQLDMRHFNNFKAEHKKVYATLEEEQKRFNIFRTNLLKIRILNALDFGTAVYGVNHLADLSQEEFQKHFTGLRLDKKQVEEEMHFEEAEFDRNAELPKEVDWRAKGAVTEVKNQGSCGSCWAFSAIGAVEAQNQIVNGELVRLSEEELVDCDTQSHGCGGGFMTWAYESLIKLGGVEAEKDYPYVPSKSDQCKFKKDKVRVKVASYQNFTKNEDEIAQYVSQKGPVSIGINANLMQFYLKGIAHPTFFLTKWLCSPSMLNHGVLIVGFGETTKRRWGKWGKQVVEPYWIIKNSWSAKWGRQGYYLIHRGSNSCGVAEMASAPKVVRK